MKRERSISLILFIAKAFLFVLSTFLFVFSAWEFRFRYGLPYNEMGKYFDEESVVVYEQQAVPFYGVMSIIFLLLTLLAVVAVAKTIRKKQTGI